MQRKSSSPLAFVIPLVCIVVYITAMLFTAYRIYSNVNQQRIAAEQEFFNLANVASASGSLGFMSEPFQTAIENALAASETLECAIISGPDGEYAFEKEAGKSIDWTNNVPTFARKFGVSSEPYFAPLRMEGQRNLTISASYRYLNYGFIIQALKQALIAALGGLALAFIAFFAQAARRNRRLQAVPENSDPAADLDFKDVEEQAERHGLGDELEEDDGPSAEAPSFDDWSSEEESADPSVDDWSSEEDQDDASSDDQDDWSHETSEFQETGDEADDEAIDFLKNQEDEDFQDTEPEREDKDPRGLYSPKSAIGWEAYTLDRLASELHRCASFEQDLVVMAIEYKPLAESDQALQDKVFRELADMAVNAFSLRDLIFERGERGATIIIPNIDLDQGFVKAEDFHNRSRAPAFQGMELCLGLSSRAGRLVNADRILFEATEALARALHDPISPIIAFRSDPEKYRAYIRNRE